MATRRKVFHFTPFDQQSLDLLVKRLHERSGIPVSQIDAVRWAIDKAIESTNPDKPAQPMRQNFTASNNVTRPAPKPSAQVRRVAVDDEA